MTSHTTKSKPRLLLLSDIWGKDNSDWVQYYLSELDDKFDVHYYDVCELAGIDIANYTAENLHTQFVNGGIDLAVKRIKEKEQEKVIILGFSIGGLIAWKAALFGLSTTNLFAISSTRLRFETQRPTGKISLFYGSLDAFSPDKLWLERMGIELISLKEETHELYRKQEIAHFICGQILSKCNHLR